ncbi:MAG: ATP synthase F0 subunit B [Desulfovibrionaceae bacterium]|jgi:F-type H+-transporting ATPase subunit b|nr:ATP synthase F0 subunit B [Desulfovibrionaceae bacterium]
MIDVDITLLIQLVNFLITLVVLNFLLVRPVREILRKRADRMAAMATDAEQFAASAEQKVKNYETALLEARQSAAAARDAMKAEGQAEEKRLLGEAGSDAAATLQKARDEVAGQVKAAMDELKGQVEALAAKAAAKVLG